MAIFGNPLSKIFDSAESYSIEGESDLIEGWERYIQERRKGKGTEEKKRKRYWREGEEWDWS